MSQEKRSEKFKTLSINLIVNLVPKKVQKNNRLAGSTPYESARKSFFFTISVVLNTEPFGIRFRSKTVL
jgi:hypothetical protein